MKIYTAGPLGFSEAGRAFHQSTILPALRQLVHEPLDPWTLTDQAKIDAVLKLPYGSERRDAWRRLNVEIGGNNRAAIDQCDAVFVVLDGVDVDSGSAAEHDHDDLRPSRGHGCARRRYRAVNRPIHLRPLRSVDSVLPVPPNNRPRGRAGTRQPSLPGRLHLQRAGLVQRER